MAKKQVLGRGLSEILGEVSRAYENNMGDSKNYEHVIEIDVDQIVPNPHQPRKNFDHLSLQELADSIKEYGLIQPVLVYKEEEQYVLIAGERRFRASKMCGQDKIKAIVADIDLTKLREIALIENIQREDLNPIDLACAYEELMNAHGLTHEELASRLQKSRAQITNTLRLLNLSHNVQRFLVEGKITQGHAKVLIGLAQEEQEKIARTVIGQKLSVRETEKMIQGMRRNNTLKNQSNTHVKQEILGEIAKILKESRISFTFNSSGKFLSISLKNQDEIQHFLTLITK